MLKRSGSAVVAILCAVAIVSAPSTAFADDTDAPMCVMANSVNRIYTLTDTEWYLSDGGTIRNPSAASVTKSFTHTVSGTYTTQVSAEVAISGQVAVAEISAKVGVSVSVSATVTKSQTFSVTVPSNKTVSYRDGIAKRHFKVTIHKTSGCHETVTYGKVTAASNYSVVVNGTQIPS